MKRVLLTVSVVLLALWGRTALYSVDYTEFAYVTQFGERVAVHDGQADVIEANTDGTHFDALLAFFRKRDRRRRHAP